MKPFAIIGYGETPFSRARQEKGEIKLSIQEYRAWASELALRDAGLEKSDLDGQGLGVCGSVYPHAEIYSSEIIQDLGIKARLLLRSDSGGNSAASLLHLAGMAVNSGVVDIVLCVGADTPMNLTQDQGIREWEYEADFQKPFGMMGPNSQFAFIMRRYMYQYGLREEDLGKIAITQREHAMLNPNAYLKVPLTMEQYLSARMIADPVRLFDACIPVNGGLAFIVASKEKAMEVASDKIVWVTGIAEYHNYTEGPMESPDITYLGVRKSAEEALTMANVRHDQINFFQPYDDYTLAVIMQIEDAGFCKKGDGGRFVREHDISYKGDLPINTGGGQLSAGQPGIAGGFVHIVEAVRQLRGEGGKRQVKDASVGMVTALGCLAYGNSLTSTTAIIMERR